MYTRRRYRSKYKGLRSINNKGYFILLNMYSIYSHYSWIEVPFPILKLRDRLKQTVLDLVIKVSKVTIKIVITVFKTESKMNRVAYMNLMLKKLL